MKYHALFVSFEKTTTANLKLLSAANYRWRFTGCFEQVGEGKVSIFIHWNRSV